MNHQEGQKIMARAIQNFVPANIRVQAPFPAYETSTLQKGEIFLPGTIKLPGEFLRSAWFATSEGNEPIAIGVAYLWPNGTTVITSTDNVI